MAFFPANNKHYPTKYVIHTRYKPVYQSCYLYIWVDDASVASVYQKDSESLSATVTYQLEGHTIKADITHLYGAYRISMYYDNERISEVTSTDNTLDERIANPLVVVEI